MPKTVPMAKINILRILSPFRKIKIFFNFLRESVEIFLKTC